MSGVRSLLPADCHNYLTCAVSGQELFYIPLEEFSNRISERSIYRQNDKCWRRWTGSEQRAGEESALVSPLPGLQVSKPRERRLCSLHEITESFLWTQPESTCLTAVTLLWLILLAGADSFCCQAEYI